jgi:hypothetical protein
MHVYVRVEEGRQVRHPAQAKHALRLGDVGDGAVERVHEEVGVGSEEGAAEQAFPKKKRGAFHDSCLLSRDYM